MLKQRYFTYIAIGVVTPFHNVIKLVEALMYITLFGVFYLPSKSPRLILLV